MRADIHPQYYQATVTCSCGNSFVTGSTKEKIHVDLCNMCHPFYTGTQKLVDTEGKVEKFARKQKIAQTHKEAIAVKEKGEEKQRQARPNSLADMVAAIRKQQKSS